MKYLMLGMANLIISPLIAFILLSNLAFAQGFDFYAGKFYEEQYFQEGQFLVHNGTYDLCGYVTKLIPLMLVNTASFNQTFTFSISGLNWANLNVDKITIPRNGRGIFYLQVSPPSDPGLYRVSIEAGSIETGLKKRAELFLDVSKCYSVDLKIEKPVDKICSGEASYYKGDIINDGEFPILAGIRMTALGWARIDKTLFELSPGKRDEFVIIVQPPDFLDGIYDIYFYAFTYNLSQPHEEKVIRLDITSRSNCYRAEIIAEDEISTITNSKEYATIRIKNKGIRDTEYKISIDGPQWASIESDSVQLNPGQHVNMNLYLYPRNISIGKYPAKLIISHGDLKFTKDFIIKIKKENNAGNFFRIFVYLIFTAAILAFLCLFALKKIKIRRNRKKLKK